MGKARRTVERRQLGLALKRLREESGLSQADTGRHVGWTGPSVSRVEDGIANLDPARLEQLLELFRVPASERETMLELGARARKRQPRGSVSSSAYMDTLPGAFQRLADMEQDASTIYHYQPGVVPGHLQSPRYMRAVMRACDGIWWQAFGREPDDRVAFRLARQARVLQAAEPKSLQFVLTQDSLLDDGLHADVMREQLDHLLTLTKKYPNIELRVLCVGALDNPAPDGGIFILGFDSAPKVGFAPVVYGPSTYFTDEQDTAAMQRAFDRIQGLALSPAESLKLIREKARET